MNEGEKIKKLELCVLILCDAIDKNHLKKMTPIGFAMYQEGRLNEVREIIKGVVEDE